MRVFKVTTFVILLCLPVSAAVYFNVPVLFNIAAALVILLAADIILFMASRGCRAYVMSDKTEYSKKNKGIMTLEVGNRCFYPVSRVKAAVTIKNRFYKGKTNYYVFPLGMFCRKKIRIPFTAVYSGIYDIHIDKLEYTDMFGILKKSLESDVAYSFFVLPNNTGNNDIDILGAIDTDSIPCDNVYSANSGDISSFREYREGDRLNSINWKLTARMENIYVREYEKTSMDEAVILLDMYINTLDNALDELWTIMNGKTNFYVFWLPAGAEEFENRYVSDKATAEYVLTDIYNSAPDMIRDRGLNEYKRLYKGHEFLYVSSKTESVQ